MIVRPQGRVRGGRRTPSGCWWVLSRSANPQPSQGIAPRRRLLARTYRHLDLDQRRTLFRLVEARTPMGEIAARLGRHPSTIYRELGRNRFRDGDRGLCGYFPLNAQDLARRRRQRRRKLATDPALREHVVGRLKDGCRRSRSPAGSSRKRTEGRPSATRPSTATSTPRRAARRASTATCRRRAADVGAATAAGPVARRSRASAGSRTGRRRSAAGRPSGTGRATC